MNDIAISKCELAFEKLQDGTGLSMASLMEIFEDGYTINSAKIDSEAKIDIKELIQELRADFDVL